MVWAIGSDDDPSTLANFRDQLGITMPVLYDEDGRVQALYEQERNGLNATYPQNWLIDANGNVLYMANTYEHATLIRLIEAELGL